MWRAHRLRPAAAAMALACGFESRPLRLAAASGRKAGRRSHGCHVPGHPSLTRGTTSASPQIFLAFPRPWRIMAGTRFSRRQTV